MIGAFLCHPFDTAKTLMQLKPNQYNSMGSVFRQHNYTNLMRGLLFPCAGFGLIFSTAFGVNTNVLEILSRRSKNGPMWQQVFAGMCAGGASAVPRVIVERVKCYSQNSGKNSIQACSTLLKQYGFRKGLVFGFRATQMREVCQFGVYYPIYNLTLSLLEPEVTRREQHSQFAFWLGGASAGVGCWILTYPIDVVKTRQQAAPPSTYKGIADCARVVYRETGLNGFWRGIGPTCIRATILHSTIFVVFENVSIQLKKFCKSREPVQQITF